MQQCTRTVVCTAHCNFLCVVVQINLLIASVFQSTLFEKGGMYTDFTVITVHPQVIHVSHRLVSHRRSFIKPRGLANALHQTFLPAPLVPPYRKELLRPYQAVPHGHTRTLPRSQMMEALGMLSCPILPPCTSLPLPRL